MLLTIQSRILLGMILLLLAVLFGAPGMGASTEGILKELLSGMGIYFSALFVLLAVDTVINNERVTMATAGITLAVIAIPGLVIDNDTYVWAAIAYVATMIVLIFGGVWLQEELKTK